MTVQRSTEINQSVKEEVETELEKKNFKQI